MPYTVVNAIIAVTLSLVLGVAWLPLGLVSFVLFAETTYLCGCLIPSTSTFTKTYFPDRAPRWLDKESTWTRAGATTSASGSAAGDDVDVESPGKEVESRQLDGDGMLIVAFDTEAALMDVGASELDGSGDKLRLVPPFESTWDDGIARTDEMVVRRWLACLTGVDEADATLESRAWNRWLVAMADGTTLDTWESNGALVVGVATDSALNSRPDDRDQLTAEQRSALTRGLRIYLNNCPACSSGARSGPKITESCCRSWEVFIIRYEDCEMRLLEVSAEALRLEAARTTGLARRPRRSAGEYTFVG